MELSVSEGGERGERERGRGERERGEGGEREEGEETREKREEKGGRERRKGGRRGEGEEEEVRERGRKGGRKGSFLSCVDWTGCTVQTQSTSCTEGADYRGRGRKERREGEVLTTGGCFLRRTSRTCRTALENRGPMAT